MGVQEVCLRQQVTHTIVSCLAGKYQASTVATYKRGAGSQETRAEYDLPRNRVMAPWML